MGSYVDKGILGELDELKTSSKDDSFNSHESAGSIKPFEMIEHYIEHQNTNSDRRVLKARILKW
jgi:hypothetical protein